MKKIAMAVLTSSMIAAPAMAADVKIGVLLGLQVLLNHLRRIWPLPPKWR